MRRIDCLILAHDASNLHVFFFLFGMNEFMILHFLAGIIVSSHLSDSLYHCLLKFYLVKTDRLIYTALCINLRKQLFLQFQNQNAIDKRTLGDELIMFMVLIMKAQDILRKKFQAKFRTLTRIQRSIMLN